MATLALQKIGEKVEEEKVLKRDDSVDLIFYLLKSTTTDEMLAPLEENFLDKFFSTSTQKTQRMTQMLLYCNDNFEDVSLDAHLRCLEHLVIQTGH